MDKGLPANLDAERFVVASILVNDRLYMQAAGELQPNDFSLEKHRRIFSRMGELHDQGERIDRVTVANELMRFNELESCDGLSYLVSLDEGMPQVLNLNSWVRIIRNKATLRSGIFAAQKLIDECLLESAAPTEILAGHMAQIQELSQRGGSAGQAIADVPLIRDCGKTAVESYASPNCHAAPSWP
jgi:replicative DNA helicase